jgi:hypothetical protein
MPKQRTEQETYAREMGLDQKVEYDGSNNAIYVGRAFPGVLATSALWQIFKMEYNSSGNMTTLRWADKNDAFDKIWNNRTSYNYVDI